MTKRIGLMTWHHTRNYGTAFQAYALKRVLEEQGCHVDLIDYRRSYNGPMKTQRVSEAIGKKIRNLPKRIGKKTQPVYDFPSQLFDGFWNDLFTYTARCRDNQDFWQLNSQYEGFVCGSDQIWGPEWIDGRFFLDFVQEPVRKIAYAPSFGVSSVEDPQTADYLGRLIQDFAYLSVREKSGCSIVEQTTARQDTKHVLDPVLLLDAREWGELADEAEKFPKGKHMFVFFLKNNPEYFEVALNRARELGLEPVVMHSSQSEDNPFANVEGFTPQELLSCLRGADYVCTDSFHMTVLSVLFHVQFQTFAKNAQQEKNSKNGRITDLLSRLGIENHEYQRGKPFGTDVDYAQVDEKLAQMRAESKEYLRQALSALPEQNPVPMDEPACWGEKKACAGELHSAFLKRWNAPCKPWERGLLEDMKNLPFTWEEKCYRCRYLPQNGNSGEPMRKPLFYHELMSDMENEPISIWQIYTKYYLLFSLKNKKRR